MASILYDVPPRTTLSKDQTQELHLILEGLVSAARKKRKGVHLLHYSIERIIGSILEFGGARVVYDYPIQVSDGPEQDSFDIYIEHQEGTNLVDVKPTVTVKDLDALAKHIMKAKDAESEAQVLLGTDALNYRRLKQGLIGRRFIDLMAQQGLGVFFADAYFVMGFENEAQFQGTEMPVVILHGDYHA